EVPGIGAARARRIAEAWSEQKAARETVAALNDLGIGAARAMRLWHRYGAETVALLRDDPYRLTRDLPGFGFAEADAAALRLGIAPDAPVRSRAGILHALGREIAAEGHCALPGAVLVERARSLLRLPRATIDAALADLVAAGDLVADAADRSCFFPAALHAAERQVAARLRRLAAGPPPWGAFDAADAVRTVEHAHGIALSQSQCRAATAVLAAKVAVLTGGPG